MQMAPRQLAYCMVHRKGWSCSGAGLLWAGAEQLVRDALSAGARVGVIGATSSSAEENVVNAALTAMGEDVAAQVQVQPLDTPLPVFQPTSLISACHLAAFQ